MAQQKPDRQGGLTGPFTVASMLGGPNVQAIYDSFRQQRSRQYSARLFHLRTYGSWHQGDTRGSVDRRAFNKYGTPKIPRWAPLRVAERSAQKHESVTFSEAQRKIVEEAIREVCRHRGYDLYAVNIRTNHAHSVVRGSVTPEKIAEAFKSYATRALRNANLIDGEKKVWARHAGTIYLWEERSITRAVEYVLYDQGDEFPDFEELVG